jgi:hypothetical protein
MTLDTTTITGLPNATLPLTGGERLVMDQGAQTVDAPVSAVAALAGTAITAAIDAHEAAADPHPGYLTPAEADAVYAAIADARFEQTLVTARNSTGTSIAKGAAVSFAGTLGTSGKLLIKPAIANGSEPGYVFLGVTEVAIANGAEGVVLTWGKIFNVNTNAFNEGDILWVNPAVPGGFTATEPQAPNLKLPVAVVVAKGIANGILMVRSSIGSRLADLHDVEANGSKSAGDVLAWDATDGRWEPKTLTAADVGAATSAQGDLADSAVQPGDLGTAAAEDVGTGAGNVVQLDNAAKLPAVDGSQLTNLPAPGTDLTYDAATRKVESSTGTDAEIPLVSTSSAGLIDATDKVKLNIAVVSDVTGVTGADAVVNIISLTQAEYDAIVAPDAATLYVITD